MPTFEVTVQINRTQCNFITKLIEADTDTDAMDILLDAVEDGSLEDDADWSEWETLDLTEDTEVLECEIVKDVDADKLFRPEPHFDRYVSTSEADARAHAIIEADINGDPQAIADTYLNALNGKA